VTKALWADDSKSEHEMSLTAWLKNWEKKEKEKEKILHEQWRCVLLELGGLYGEAQAYSSALTPKLARRSLGTTELGLMATINPEYGRDSLG